MLDVDSAEHIRNAEFTVDFDRKVFAGVIPQQDTNNPIYFLLILLKYILWRG
ncbi:Uncharacterised protein [Actinobacillus equuli]|nr:Uncharacterised protein [Actinobacillus equuli]